MMRKGFNSDVWMEKIAFLDGVSFTHKTNPADKAKAPKGRTWRKANERLNKGCTAKGSHYKFYCSFHKTITNGFRAG